MSDLVPWILITGVLLAYLHKTSGSQASANILAPDAQREVDLTRWRHDGTQPVLWYKGNGSPFVDETARKMQTLIT